jgi:hypothetical protein
VYVLRIRAVIVIVFFHRGIDMYAIEKMKMSSFDQSIYYFTRSRDSSVGIFFYII